MTADFIPSYLSLFKIFCILPLFSKGD